MGTITKNLVNELNSYFDLFCKHVKYRESEDFYSILNRIYELSYNENPLGMGKLTRNALERLARWGYRYPPMDYSILRKEIAIQNKLSDENIIITPGSITAVYLAIHQWVNPNEKVIFSNSSLPWYNWIVLSNGSVPEIVPLFIDMNHDLEAMLKKIDKDVKAIIISNPHNPTGLYIDEKRIKRFIESIPANVLIVIDQAYYEYQSSREIVLLNLLKKSHNILLTRTFSKLHGMAGLRVGYGLANKELINLLRAKWIAFTPSINAPSVFASYHALQDKEHIEKSRKFNFEVKNKIYELADKYQVEYLKSESNFVALNVVNSKVIEKYFIDHDFQLTPGYVFGYPEWIRISFIREKKRLYKQLDYVFKEVVKLKYKT